MGKPGWGHAQSPLPEHIGQVEGTGETETSKYPEEKKATCDSLSSGERNGKSLNRDSGTACRRCCRGVVGPAGRNGRFFQGVTKLIASRTGLESRATEGNSPVRESNQPPGGAPE